MMKLLASERYDYGAISVILDKLSDLQEPANRSFNVKGSDILEIIQKLEDYLLDR